jgi:FkbM family methyltransferase
MVVLLLRSYFRWFPFTSGKRVIWRRIIVPHILWRPLRFRAKTFFGAKISIQFPDVIQVYIFFFGTWEPAISKYIKDSLRAGDTFIDIGANIGYDSLLAATCVGETGRVYAFEASPGIFAKLKQNVATNNATNVTTYNFAIADCECEVSIYKSRPENLGSSTIIPQIAGNRGAIFEATVRGLPLLSILDDEIVRRARIIKIDVEGAEWRVLMGIMEILPETARHTELIVEIDQTTLARDGVSLDDIVSLFNKAGFEGFIINNAYDIDFYVADPAPHLRPIREIGSDRFWLAHGLADAIFRRRN